jgi:hypothetical protein
MTSLRPWQRYVASMADEQEATSDANTCDTLTSVPATVTGLWGEALVVRTLRGLGCSVDWEGGLTKGRDLRARYGDRRFHVQVKCSTVEDGRVAWRGSGDRAREWAESVENLGEGPAIFALVHLASPSQATFDLKRGVLTVLLPPEYSVTVIRAAEFADDVDAARREYGSRLRKVRGRNGEEVGSLLSPDGLGYPVRVVDYPALNEYGLRNVLG